MFAPFIPVRCRHTPVYRLNGVTRSNFERKNRKQLSKVDRLLTPVWSIVSFHAAFSWLSTDAPDSDALDTMRLSSKPFILPTAWVSRASSELSAPHSTVIALDLKSTLRLSGCEVDLHRPPIIGRVKGKNERGENPAAWWIVLLGLSVLVH